MKTRKPKEYDFSHGIRGKYAARLAAGSRVVVLDPDVARVFPDSKSVNEVLRALAVIFKRRSRKAS
jgi:hypothetical protein